MQADFLFAFALFAKSKPLHVVFHCTPTFIAGGIRGKEKKAPRTKVSFLTGMWLRERRLPQVHALLVSRTELLRAYWFFVAFECEFLPPATCPRVPNKLRAAMQWHPLPA
ncbi:unnamed protein product [Scytosiphon promiscuus]